MAESIMDLVREKYYPGWDSNDPVFFERVVREIFSPEFRMQRPGEEPATLDEVLPVWLQELAEWNPQRHTILDVVDAGDACAWEYLFEARHAPTGRDYAHKAVVVARWDGRQITSYNSYIGSLEYMTKFVEAGLPAGVGAAS